MLTACSLSTLHGNGLMSHIRETSKVTINTSYFHPAHQHCTDEAQKAETVPSVYIYIFNNYIYIYIYVVGATSGIHDGFGVEAGLKFFLKY
jgi:hypothetical protein